MAAAEIRSSSDQKKLIWAVALGVLAIIAIWWTFVGFGSSTKPQPRGTAASQSTSPSPTKPGNPPLKQSGNIGGDLSQAKPVDYGITLPVVPEPRRNIFAYYEPTPTPSPIVSRPSTPLPTPWPWLLASLSPSNVYAKTEDFSLEARGDKFTPAALIVIDGRPFPTRYISPQQVSALVPAAVIASPGQRQIVVRTSDNLLSSNSLSLSVNAPPTPNYTYVGNIGKQGHIGDTAFLQDKSSKEIIGFHIGEFLDNERRFRVTSISESKVLVVDTNLKIKHTLQLTSEGEKGTTLPLGRPTPKVQSEDDEP